MTPQQAKLRAGVDLVVGTPGRLVDLTDRADLRLSSLRVLVLDEADQMLEIGFKDDLEKLFQVVLLHSILCLPGRPSAMHERHEGDSMKDTKETETLQTCMDTQAVIADTTKHGGTHTHQTLLFSATLPSWVQGVARKYLRPDLRADVDLVSGLSLLGKPRSKTLYASCVHFWRPGASGFRAAVCQGMRRPRRIAGDGGTAMRFSSSMTALFAAPAPSAAG